jgi:tetratricopeptide (TPR) repeat protein
MLETMTIGLQIGLDKYDSGQYEQALNQVEKILFVEENFPSDTLKSVALALGGLASLNLGQYDKAISYFNSALEIDSTLALSQSRDLAINLQREDDLEYEEEETEIPCIENPQCRDRANFDIQNARNALELPTLDLSR